MKKVKLYEQYITEGRNRYDSIARRLTADTIKKWVADVSKGQKKSSFYEQVMLDGHKKIEFDLDCTLYIEGRGFEILGSTGADGRDIDDDGDDQTPYIIVDFKCQADWLPGYWSEIYMHLSDVIRHEIEHITQAGENIGNYRPGKPSEDDQGMRDMIKSGVLPQHLYLLLPKEVDANLQGLRYEAKKRIYG